MNDGIHPPDFYKKRVVHLEEAQRFTLEALNLVLDLNDFGESFSRLTSAETIFAKSQNIIKALIDFRSLAFFTINDEDQNLNLAYAFPEEDRTLHQGILNELVEKGQAATVLRSDTIHFLRHAQSREVMVKSLNSQSRCRGLFIGVLNGKRNLIHDALLTILVILLQATAQALESFELYSLLRSKNERLDAQLGEIRQSQEELTQERSALETTVKKLNEQIVERKTAEIRLAESRNMLRLVMDSIPQFVSWKNDKLIYQGCNNNFLRATGLERVEDLVGLSDFELPWTREEAEGYRAAEQRILSSGIPEYAIIETQRQTDGRVIWIETNKVPLLDSHGRVIGILACFQDISERQKYEQKLTHLALHDALTDMPNRTLFMDRLKQCMERVRRSGRFHFAVILLDLDNFKAVNDTLGHMSGDKVLVEVSHRISGCLRGVDTVARLGGDEFAILLTELANAGESIRIIKRMLGSISRVIKLEGKEIFPATSAGIVLNLGQYSSTEDILRDADIAMYSAKSSGGNRIKVFRPSMHAKALTRATVESDLRMGLIRNEFRVHYQPIFTLSSGILAGFEALIRWQHPLRGLLPPGDFISVAEDTGLIINMDLMVLRQACFCMQEWMSNGNVNSGMSMSVNLSAKHLHNQGLPMQIKAILEATKLPSHFLRIEITESAVMKDADMALTILQQIKTLGVRLALDDFGTGYSSLAYLQRFPLDVLKIDRAFIVDLCSNTRSLEIVKAVISIGMSMGFKIVAEGVESIDQASLLGTINCDYVQGFHYSRPVNESIARGFLCN
ncbi:MAG: hypothetical protein CVU73_05820 [Deltaproteobacteria bacterium HGW-Deltaproteobacteria-8]|jgi:diguanylate cyclase (GGDEF)-like protein/PAS domain S-box-containing protein|nr:MAG: hypothetical protein CVU73_05820 [Deltaproteobacteria bacterium HGW-Deltaproteobacteria-8]